MTQAAGLSGLPRALIEVVLRKDTAMSPGYEMLSCPDSGFKHFISRSHLALYPGTLGMDNRGATETQARMDILQMCFGLSYCRHDFHAGR